MSLRKKIAGIALAILACAGTAAAQKGAVAPATVEFNPMRAVHDVQVGKFYMKRGDLDGAISRFKEAIEYRPNYAEPRLLLGEAYEKKNDPAMAIGYYRQYLKILPDTDESKKVRERIARLEEKMKREKSEKGARAGSGEAH